MNIEILMFFYMGVCASMILFNCAVLVINVLRKKQINKSDRRLEPKIRAQLERLEWGEGLEEGHLEQMNKIFKKVAKLGRFEDSMDVLRNEKPGLCQSYIKALGPCFVSGAADYFKRDTMEATYFAWLIRKYEAAEKENRDFWTKEIRALLQRPSIYCRENALNILYCMGNAADVVDALLLLDERHVFHHSKLIHDGLLKFGGDKNDLLKEIWGVFERFSAAMQVTLISYMRMASAECCEQVFEVMMRLNQDDEVYFACMRYFGKIHYEPAYPVLLDALSKPDGRRWERAAIAATVLRNYPSEGSVDVLVQALHSSNWYIRNNAAETLESFGLTYADMVEVFEGNDRYAREILQYWMDYRSVKQGVLVREPEAVQGKAAVSKQREENRMITKLKRGFMGYSRRSVDAYIDGIKEEYEKRLSEAEAAKKQELLEREQKLSEKAQIISEKERMLSELQLRIQRLEEEAAGMKEENSRLREKETAISLALVEAKEFSLKMRQETERACQSELERTREQCRMVKGRIDRTAGSIQEFQKMLLEVCGRIGNEMNQYTEQCEAFSKELEQDK